MMLDAYTRDFKANINVCNAVKRVIRISEATTRLACILESQDYNDLSSFLNGESR